MLQKIGKYEPDDENYPGEYRAYLKTFADHHIFNKENTGQLLAAKMRSPEEILNFAIRIELESMFFYMEAKHYVPKTQTEVIDRIVEEERSHYLKLIQLQTTISKP
jgi:rubrerythrin